MSSIIAYKELNPESPDKKSGATEQPELTRERGTGAGRGSLGNAGRKEK